MDDEENSAKLSHRIAAFFHHIRQTRSSARPVSASSARLGWARPVRLGLVGTARPARLGSASARKDLLKTGSARLQKSRRSRAVGSSRLRAGFSAVAPAARGWRRSASAGLAELVSSSYFRHVQAKSYYEILNIMIISEAFPDFRKHVSSCFRNM